jgi:hypothetical protein
MMNDHSKQGDDRPQHVSRRDIIKLITTAGLIAGCRSVEQTVAPSAICDCPRDSDANFHRDADPRSHCDAYYGANGVVHCRTDKDAD